MFISAMEFVTTNKGVCTEVHKILNHVRKHKENCTNPNSWTMTQKKMKCMTQKH